MPTVCACTALHYTWRSVNLPAANAASGLYKFAQLCVELPGYVADCNGR